MYKFSFRSPLDASKVDWAIAVSIAAMLAFNVLVLTQQLHSAPAFTMSPAAAAQQA